MRIDRRGFMGFLSAGGAASVATRAELDAAPNAPAVTEALLRSGPPVYTPQMDVLNWTLYDRTVIDPADGEGFQRGRQRWGAFQNPLGSGGNWRGLEETNMVMHGRLPMPQVFKVQRIYFLFDPENDPLDNEALRREGSWQFQINEKLYGQGPMMEFRTVAGLRHVINEKGYPNGMVPAEARRYGPDCNFLIDSGAFFTVTFNVRHPFRIERAVSFYTFLDGIIARPVQ